MSFQMIGQFESFPAQRALMLPDGRVRCLMVLQVTRLRETLPTHLALERFYLGVNSQMLREVALLDETLVAVLALVRPRGLVGSQVNLQVVILAERFVADVAPYQALAGVKPLVRLQILQQAKSFLAAEALETFAVVGPAAAASSFMGFQVFPEIRRIREYFVAEFARVHVGFRVETCVRVQLALRGVRFLAVRTFERLLTGVR